MSAPTREDMELALARIDFCTRLQGSEEYQAIVLPVLKERRDHHYAQGTNILLPAEKRAEHHEALHLAERLLKLLDTEIAEKTDIVKRYRDSRDTTL